MPGELLVAARVQVDHVVLLAAVLPTVLAVQVRPVRRRLGLPLAVDDLASNVVSLPLLLLGWELVRVTDFILNAVIQLLKIVYVLVVEEVIVLVFLVIFIRGTVLVDIERFHLATGFFFLLLLPLDISQNLVLGFLLQYSLLLLFLFLFFALFSFFFFF
jgi:hypothetical protein